MEDIRSTSWNDSRMQIESYSNKPGRPGSGPGPGPGPEHESGHSSYGTNGIRDLRCYSTSYASSVHPTQTQTQMGNRNSKNETKFKKAKSTNGSSLSKSWSLNDPELQRKKRVASYKVYTVEGKVKGSFKKSFRWIKDKCSRIIHGW